LKSRILLKIKRKKVHNLSTKTPYHSMMDQSNKKKRKNQKRKKLNKRK
jgi:hypothetical protein